MGRLSFGNITDVFTPKASSHQLECPNPPTKSGDSLTNSFENTPASRASSKSSVQSFTTRFLSFSSLGEVLTPAAAGAASSSECPPAPTKEDADTSSSGATPEEGSVSRTSSARSFMSVVLARSRECPGAPNKEDAQDGSSSSGLNSGDSSTGSSSYGRPTRYLSFSSLADVFTPKAAAVTPGAPVKDSSSGALRARADSSASVGSGVSRVIRALSFSAPATPTASVTPRRLLSFMGASASSVAEHSEETVDGGAAAAAEMPEPAEAAVDAAGSIANTTASASSASEPLAPTTAEEVLESAPVAEAAHSEAPHATDEEQVLFSSTDGSKSGRFSMRGLFNTVTARLRRH